MLTVKGIYQDGKLILEEPVDTEKGYKVFVTFVEEMAFANQSKTRRIGGLGGKVWMSDDFNEPLDDLKDYM